MMPILGLLVLVAIAVALSESRRHIPWRLVGAGLALQALIAFCFLRFPPAVAAADLVAAGVARVIGFADEGTRFVFGNVSDPSGAWGFIFIVRVLPIIIFFASLMSVLYHLGIMQRVVAGCAWGLRRAMQVSGVEALCAAANIFVGQTEAPLMIRPFIPSLTRSQLMTVMAAGFATIAGSVLGAYVSMLGGDTEVGRITMAKHLLTASLMSAPAAIVFAKIMVPERETVPPETLAATSSLPRTTANIMDAAAEGATDGLKLALNVAAMLVAFVSLIALLNWPLAGISTLPSIEAFRLEHGIPVLTFQNILGVAFTPIAWCMGFERGDVSAVAALMGTQLVATEFVAYLDLAAAIKAGTISPRSAQMAAYALCGFANLPSIAIQIGGLSAMAPNRRADAAALGFRAMTAGALACWSTATIAGTFL
jgi:CNT family concentrative nucleoside transporter